MKTVALRYAENFAPGIGTIAAHQQLIDTLGYVWYGKLGAPLSDKTVKEVLQNNSPRILLIHSGKIYRYWAYVENISRTIPPENEIPEYYREIRGKFKVWFKIKAFTRAQPDIMSKCQIASSRRILADVSKYSMSPYFIITIEDDEK